MRDADIRPALINFLSAEASTEDDLDCIEELGICGGESRVDFAVLSNSIHGYEIKGETDSLVRLGTQIEYYSRALGFVTAVVAEKHCTRLIERAPEWWGILVVREDSRSVIVTRLRNSSPNPAMDSYAIAQFLWRDEALDLLTREGLDWGIRTKPRKCLWERMSDSFELDALTRMVSSTLRQRQAWRTQKLAG